MQISLDYFAESSDNICMNESEREGEFKHNVRMFNENVAMCIHFANLMEDYASGSDIKLSKKVLKVYFQ